MKKFVRMLIAAACGISFVGGLVFVFGQTACIFLDRPDLVIQIETTVSSIVFPMMALAGLLCFFYNYFDKKLYRIKKKEAD